eukprot:353149-Chlamydomonas_euryale.AAC.11
MAWPPELPSLRRSSQRCNCEGCYRGTSSCPQASIPTATAAGAAEPSSQHSNCEGCYRGTNERYALRRCWVWHPCAGIATNPVPAGTWLGLAVKPLQTSEHCYLWKLAASGVAELRSGPKCSLCAACRHRQLRLAARCLWPYVMHCCLETLVAGEHGCVDAHSHGCVWEQIQWRRVREWGDKRFIINPYMPACLGLIWTQASLCLVTSFRNDGVLLLIRDGMQTGA